MGIRLDWEIEAEHTTHTAQEDPKARWARQRARLQLLLGVVILVGILTLIVVIVRERLRAVDRAEEQVLIDTVAAELAALRLGDLGTYRTFFRSDDMAWMSDRLADFDLYQNLKQRDAVQLTGRVSDVEIDGQRGRVVIEEIVEGVPFARVQFYWHYPDDGDDPDDTIDGWRRVPPDYRFFWGELALLEGEHTQIAYREVDAAIAASVRDTLDSWLSSACAVLLCAEVPTLQVDISPEPGATIRWAADREWLLRFPSPYVDGARLDMPFDPQRRFEAAGLVADRLIDSVLSDRAPRYPWDAYYLRQGVASWLVGRFAQINTNTFLIESLTANYGETAIGDLLANLQPESDVDVLSVVTGQTLDAAALDWRDFFTWRLALENDLIAAQDYDNFSWLYKFEDPAILETLNDRYSLGTLPDIPVVIGVQPTDSSPEGNPRLLAITQRPGLEGPVEGQVIFELIANVWKRAS